MQATCGVLSVKWVWELDFQCRIRMVQVFEYKCFRQIMYSRSRKQMPVLKTKANILAIKNHFVQWWKAKSLSGWDCRMSWHTLKGYPPGNIAGKEKTENPGLIILKIVQDVTFPRLCSLLRSESSGWLWLLMLPSWHSHYKPCLGSWDDDTSRKLMCWCYEDCDIFNHIYCFFKYAIFAKNAKIDLTLACSPTALIIGYTQ